MRPRERDRFLAPRPERVTAPAIRPIDRERERPTDFDLERDRRRPPRASNGRTNSPATRPREWLLARPTDFDRERDRRRPPRASNGRTYSPPRPRDIERPLEWLREREADR